MLARRLTTILPALTLAEAIETTRIPRVAGLTGARTALVTTRPCRAPHHTLSDAGLIGGGQVPLPGEVSLAHHGILFLDELPEFRRHVLEVLRQPLEEGVTRIQSPARPKSQGFSDLSQSADGRKPVRPSPLAAHDHRDGPDHRGRTTSPVHPNAWSHLVLFA
jgi:Magnesium chelatase, subunit ChlI